MGVPTKVSQSQKQKVYGLGPRQVLATKGFCFILNKASCYSVHVWLRQRERAEETQENERAELAHQLPDWEFPEGLVTWLAD